MSLAVICWSVVGTMLGSTVIGMVLASRCIRRTSLQECEPAYPTPARTFFFSYMYKCQNESTSFGSYTVTIQNYNPRTVVERFVELVREEKCDEMLGTDVVILSVTELR